MKFGVVVFPGSNCDEDTIYLLSSLLKQPFIRLWHKDNDLQNCDFIILPGGFTFGDYLRSGAIARFSPIMEKIIPFARAGGNVLGICNGFQILVESGLLPGALLLNQNRKFISRDVYLKTICHNSLLTQFIKEETILKMPIAHGEGRYFADKKTLQQLYQNDQILFKYCHKQGELEEFNEFVNPNGSLDAIAGICNHERNVFGMMPHPERASISELGNQDGLSIFLSILRALSKSFPAHTHEIIG